MPGYRLIPGDLGRLAYVFSALVQPIGEAGSRCSHEFAWGQATARWVYVVTAKFQPTAFLQLGHLGKVSPTANVTRSLSAQSLR